MNGGLEVLHADNHVLVVNKPACLPCVPDSSEDESLLDRAKAWVKREYEKPGAVFLGVVHRLDRPVSGLVVFGRTSKGADRLSSQFRERRVEKIYWGIVAGCPASPAGEVEQWLRKDRGRNFVEVARGEGGGAQLARTSYRVLGREGGTALLELIPHTGRPHQLRVACASLGTPLLGDLKYGAAEALADRSIALHARRLAFDHPTRDERLDLVAEPPWRRYRAR
jgi:23S rRNA pseudouridine1911/1915/1917 synthase